MGDTIWVDVRGRAKNDLPSDNSILLRLKDELDRLSEKLGVSKLSEFYDYSAAAEYFADEISELEAEAGSEETWFDPAKALIAVRSIHSHLTQHPEDLGFKASKSQAHWPGLLIEELSHCQAVLEKASLLKQEFRFLIVP